LLRRSGPGECDDREDFEQHLCAGVRGVGGGVILRRDLDDIAATISRPAAPLIIALFGISLNSTSRPAG
jgi:hypothetical protein